MIKYFFIILFSAILVFIHDLKNPEISFKNHYIKSKILLDRNGYILDRLSKQLSDQNHNLLFFEFPSTLVKAIILLEDKSFFEHSGVDYWAKLRVIWHAIAHPTHKKLGASGITEQVIRIMQPRSRTLWTKALEMVEAHWLTLKIDKTQILQFYLNNLPYSHNIIGVEKAAKFYFGRDIQTLNNKEQIALAYLPRSPMRLQKAMTSTEMDVTLSKIAKNLKINMQHYALKKVSRSKYQNNSLFHYIQFINRQDLVKESGRTSLDVNLQNKLHYLLSKRLDILKDYNVGHAALIVIDNHSGHVMSYLNVGKDCLFTGYKQEGCYIDLIQTPRQPGSTLKPFVYALAISKGWSDATIINDTQYSEVVSSGGVHQYRNYSKKYYGKISVRTALANSLNIPALHAVNFVGVDNFYEYLHKLGMRSLKQDPKFYGNGLVLGNGEITLMELARAYAVLARGGKSIDLQFSVLQNSQASEQIIPLESANIVTDILRDSEARKLEFSGSNALNIDDFTAIKTGTSTASKDAFSVGYDTNYTVAIWMGNVDRSSMYEITGSNGPGPLLGQVFRVLRQSYKAKAFNKNFKSKNSGITEAKSEVAIISPLNNQRIAIDPRVPLDKQALSFKVSNEDDIESVEWLLDNKAVQNLGKASAIWNLDIGKHSLVAKIKVLGSEKMIVKNISFIVK